jgi:hypothetical protein
LNTRLQKRHHDRSIAFAADELTLPGKANLLAGPGKQDTRASLDESIVLQRHLNALSSTSADPYELRSDDGNPWKADARRGAHFAKAGWEKSARAST